MTNTQAGIVLQHIGRLTGTRSTAQAPDAELLERFAAQRDEAAFAALVKRHGPMVLNVCRSILRHEQDAEDAFQATFLVLARKANAIRQPGALAGWLHEVAHHAALKAQANAVRRRAQERRAAPPAAANPALDMTLRDLQRVLHEELRRLPEKYRLPLVLCYLEDRSREEAASQLGWSKGTVRGRLERGRERLRRRLMSRGVALSGLLCAAVAPRAAGASLLGSVLGLGASAGRGLLPESLTQAAVCCGVAVAAGASAAAIVPPPVAALAAGVSRAMLVTKAKITAVVLLAAGLLIAGAGAVARQAPAVGEPLAGSPKPEVGTPPPAPAAAKEAARPAAREDRDSITYGGRVLGPDGRPVAGAKLYLTIWWGYHYEPFTGPDSATTDRDGRFAFTAPKAKYQGQASLVSAAAPNLGVGWVGLDAGDKRTDLTLKLVADDVPVTGQVVGLEGKPVAGATLRVLQVMASPKEDLGPWLKAAKDRTAPQRGRSLAIDQEYLPSYTTAPSAVATTDAAGRFRLTGIGRERLTIVRLEGPTIASEYLHIRTRPGEAIQVGELEADPEYGTPRIDVTYYGSSFRHVAAPTRPVVGVVRDKDTKKPLAGVTVRSEKLAHNPVHGIHITETVTDAQGRYRLSGLPKGAGNKIGIVPPRDLPYVAPVLEVPDNFGPDAVTVDVELKRAVWIEGKLTDKATGKPLPGYHLMYLVTNRNPKTGDYAGFFGGMNSSVTTNEDGSYRIIGLPGPGVITVFQNHKEDYLYGAEREDEDGLKEDFGYVPQSNFAAFVRIDPAKGSESVRRDIALVRGWTFTGKLLGPDDRPLVGAVMGGSSEVMKTAEFTVRRFNPLRPRPVFFRHPGKGLVGVAQPPKEDGGSVTVRMGPGAAVTGRIVDAGGEPRAGVEIWVSFHPKGEPHWQEQGLQRDEIKTDREGRFRIEALLPGLDYELVVDHRAVRFGRGLEAGKTKDLGDLR
jgi:RNA polymerase sigma factor (sigma-70 family)